MDKDEEQKPQGWEVVDTSVPEETLTPEQETLAERFSRRVDLAEPIVEGFFPEVDFEERAAIDRGIPKSQLDLDEESIAIIRDEERSYRISKESLATEIARSNIPEDQLPEFVEMIVETGKILRTQPGLLDPKDSKSWVGACSSLEEAKWQLQEARKWEARFIHSLDLSNPAQKADAQRAIRNLNGFVVEMRGYNRTPRPDPISNDDATVLLDEFYNAYGLALRVEHNLQKPPDQQPDYFRKVIDDFLQSLESGGAHFRDTKFIKMFSGLFERTRDFDDKDATRRFLSSMSRYMSHHDVSQEALDGLSGKMLPALARHDEDVEVLQKDGNLWGMGRGDFGVADFVCHCFASKASPERINELLMAAREVPATALAKIETNRRDGLSLSGVFGALRDFIHDQRPGVHDILEAMVQFYETGDSKNLLSLASQTEGYLGTEERKALLIDKSKYDELVKAGYGSGEVEERAIDVLKRLEQNTRPVPDLPPPSSDQNLNEQMSRLEKEIEENGEAGIKGILDYVNNQLIAMMKGGEVGISPGFVLSISWIERQVFRLLQNLNYETQLTTHGQDWFRPVLLFQELIASPGEFDEAKFNAYADEVANSGKNATGVYFSRISEQIGALADRYRREGRSNWADALWSGNVAHELIGMIDYKPASTEYGRKHREEASRPYEERLKGD